MAMIYIASCDACGFLSLSTPTELLFVVIYKLILIIVA